MYRFQDRHSSRLFRFLLQRSRHYCLVDLYSRLSRDSVVAFVDLKSAWMRDAKSIQRNTVPDGDGSVA
ncbi:hypothetical protein E2C01_068952 [Portunus trituberculatus]|uniref:Uncharacterized protein n=1 Tax=Portunus trituberculatus TaxID=210409 RepID=A0A5B7I0W4_PORTR|nr:hypothetical protein [Portunus trituberculatus]